MVVTPTASGKTLCYNLPVVHAILADPSARAVFLFPTKALAEDQRLELQRLNDAVGGQLSCHTYDGDTPSDARRTIRERANIVLTNPDMLHTGILPHHTKWVKLFENLKYFVIDELHFYRGVYGSHLANVIRRLKRICEFYGSKPQFICCSATIRQSETSGRIHHGRAVRTRRRERRAVRRPLLRVLQPAGGESPARHSPQLSHETRRIAVELIRQKQQTLVFTNNRLATEDTDDLSEGRLLASAVLA